MNKRESVQPINGRNKQVLAQGKVSKADSRSQTKTVFKLKCVGCGKVETRPAEQCHQQPFCECGMPMVLQTVASVRLAKERA